MLTARSTLRVGHGLVTAFSLFLLLSGDLSAHVREDPGSQLRLSTRGALHYAQADPDSREAEETFWDAVKDSGDPDLIDAYLQSFPDGAFAAQARAKLAELRGKSRQADIGPHPFTEDWATPGVDCKETDPSKIPFFPHRRGLVKFQSAKTAQYISPRRAFTCTITEITNLKSEFTLTADCRENYYFATSGIAQTGNLSLRGDTEMLTGLGPDGAKLNLFRCHQDITERKRFERPTIDGIRLGVRPDGQSGDGRAADDADLSGQIYCMRKGYRMIIEHGFYFERYRGRTIAIRDGTVFENKGYDEANRYPGVFGYIVCGR